MNYLLLMAGGVGNRVGAGVPKQFIQVFGKPIIAYTMQIFEQSPLIDGILLVCVKGFEDELMQIVKEYGISKVLKVVEGGKDYEHSIMNGVRGFENIASPEDVIMIHWAAAPFVTEDILEDNIKVCEEKGNAISSCKAFVLYGKNNGDHAEGVIDRDSFLCMTAPHSFLFKNIQNLYKEALQKNVFDYIEPHTTNIMAELGVPIFFSKGSQTNIKITTKEDVELFKGYVLLKQHSV